MYSSYIRFGFFGLVAGGKSVTAGIFAIGITPEGKIGWIDGEGRRSGYAIDVVADMAAAHYGGDKQEWIDRFEVIHIDPPFNPLRVVAAIELLEELGCKTVIADILTQAWDSEGGYLDMKDEELHRMAANEQTEAAKIKKMDKSSSSAAAHVKPWTHGKLVNKINASRCNMVLLFQAKQKYNAKTFKPDEFITPIQESLLTRVALAVGRVEAKMVNGEPQGGFCTFKGAIEQGTKYTHPKIFPLLPKNGEQFKFSHAEAIRKWCQGSPQETPGTTPQPAPVQAAPKADTKPATDKTTPKARLWKLLEGIHGGDKTVLVKWLRDRKILQDAEKLESLIPSRIEEMIDMAEIILNEGGE